MIELTERAKKQVFFEDIANKFGSEVAHLMQMLGYQDLDLAFFIARKLEEEKRRFNNLEFDLMLALNLLENHQFLEILYQELKTQTKNLDQKLVNIGLSIPQIFVAQTLIPIFKQHFCNYQKNQNYRVQNLEHQFENSEEKKSEISNKLFQILEIRINLLMQVFLQRMMQEERENLPQLPSHASKKIENYKFEDLKNLSAQMSNHSVAAVSTQVGLAY